MGMVVPAGLWREVSCFRGFKERNDSSDCKCNYN